MARLILAAAASLALAACGSGGDDRAAGNQVADEAVGNEAAANAGAAAPAADAGGGGGAVMQPGEWEVSVEMAGMTVPGADGAEGMKMPAQTHRTCVTAEQAASPPADMFTGQKGCTSEGFSAGGGRVSGTVTCDKPGEGRVKMTMDGQVGSTSYDVTSKMDMEGMTMTMTARGRRIGECPAGKQG
jgi:hypothetical protein